MPSVASIAALFGLLGAAVAQSSVSIPPPAEITKGMPKAPKPVLDKTFAPGTAAIISGAPAIPPTPLDTNYPVLDKVPPLDSPEVKKWISQINWDIVPKFSPTTGECYTSKEAEADKSRCWWTCGGCVRETDITECPDKLTWGLSFDDGPSEYTPLLLNYLNQANITTTWFVVGSRVVSDPEIVVSEYMTGHQISGHTWSHPALTSLSNEEIVAELGWTSKAIKDTIGVTPNTFRPPYGDIDDRVRAIAAQMGLTPIMWSAIDGTSFDTDDWNIMTGHATGETSLNRFQKILSEYAPRLDAGFIVLEHDLYQQTVDLAVGYFLPLALKSGYLLKSVIDCLHKPLSEAYHESASNRTLPATSSAANSSASAGPASTSGATNGTASTSAGAQATTHATSENNVVKNAAGRVGASELVLAAAVIAALAL